MAELLEYSHDTPPVVMDDEGNIRNLADYPDDFELSPETPSSEPVLEELPRPDYPKPREVMPLAHPSSIEENKRRITNTDLARAAITERQLTAYEEYGGGIRQIDEYEERDLPRYRPLDDIIRGSEPWQTEIYDAVERFGINELPLEKYEAMGDAQRLHFTLHFANFYNAITRHIKLIKLEDKSAEQDMLLARRYGNDRTEFELLAYSARLEALKQAMDKTGIPSAVTADLTPRKEKVSKNINYWDYQIGFKLKPDGSKQPRSIK
ncbi:MAG: hypothetical protein JWM00_216 [Candidatus Saccharibacteria bacterium]|nr:hypothetical protein [Candidatus Saccharibacteria bacterium]